MEGHHVTRSLEPVFERVRLGKPEQKFAVNEVKQKSRLDTNQGWVEHRWTVYI